MTTMLPVNRRNLSNAVSAIALGAACIPSTAPAQEAPAAAPTASAPAPDWVVTGNAALVSDYRFRGISQTQHRPTWQLTLEAAHASGVYLGTFGSGVSNAAYTNGSGAEIDLYGGWRHAFDQTSNIDLGLVTYWYPNAYFTGGDGATIHFNTQEIKAAYNLGAFNLTAWTSPTSTWFGFVYDPVTGERRNTRWSSYFEGNWNPALSSSVTLNLHLGTQRFRGISAYNFVDAKAGVTWTHDRWALSAAVTHNTGKVSKDGKPVWTFFNADGSGTDVAGTRALLTAAYSF